MWGAKMKEIIIFLIQLFMFYIFPLFAGPKDAMGMVAVIIISTFILALCMGVFSKNKMKYVYPLFAAALFVPSVFIYYNSSALVHSLWYFVTASIGLIVGIGISRLNRKK